MINLVFIRTTLILAISTVLSSFVSTHVTVDWSSKINELFLCPARCIYGQFRLVAADACRPWLNCREIAEIEVIGELGQGAVKTVYLGKYYGKAVVVNQLRFETYREDFLHGLDMLKQLQLSPHVTALYGYCNDTYITQYHRLGSADNIDRLLRTEPFKVYDTNKIRFRLCLSYVDIISFLHRSPAGTRVMCDSNDLYKTLSQYLITDDLQLVVNDLDALPEVTNRSRNGLIKCGRREITGDFPAPEQLWTPSVPDEPFTDEALYPYDEKTDVWKIPDVCDYFINGDDEGDDNDGYEHTRRVNMALRFHLFPVHRKCKVLDPSIRTTSHEVARDYRRVWNELFPRRQLRT